MNRYVAVLLAAVLVTGCHDNDHGTGPRDVVAPAAPRGVRSITGDHTVYLSWLANTEGDVAGYRVYKSDCGDPDCVFDPVGETQDTWYTVTQLPNGQKQYFAVLAFDRAGNESELSYDDVFDTPRPEGYGVELANFYADSLRSGFDFSTSSVVNYSSVYADVFYAARDGTLMSVGLRLSADRAEIGEPQPLFPLQLGTSGEIPWIRHYFDVSPDGQRFIVIRRAPETEPDSAVVVTNWTAVLGKTR